MKGLVLRWAAIVLAGGWLASWGAGVGVLVYSEGTQWKIGRQCHYLVGVTVVRKLDPIGQRCELFKAGL